MSWCIGLNEVGCHDIMEFFKSLRFLINAKSY
jgi:hypothetical protein